VKVFNYAIMATAAAMLSAPAAAQLGQDKSTDFIQAV
jgi:hypothetical protein